MRARWGPHAPQCPLTPRCRLRSLLWCALVALCLAAGPAEALRLWDGRRWFAPAPAPAAPSAAPAAPTAAARLLSPRSRPLPGVAAGPGLDAVATVFDPAALDALRARAAAPAPPAPEAQHLRAPGPQGSADSAPALDPERARLLARLESISYCPRPADVAAWNCSRCAGVPGFVVHEAHFDAAWDLSGYAGYLPSIGAKVLVFRGTDSSSLYNWVENMRAWRTDATYPIPGAPPALRIHSGFNVLWNSSSMAATFRAAYARMLAAHPTGPTYIVGHSMGGALAHLCALDLRATFDPPDMRVYTFGSPRVGNSVFAAFFDAHVAQSWRFTHGRDVVPSLPPMLLGSFHHVSREIWLVDVDGPGRRYAGDGSGASSGSSSRSEIGSDTGSSSSGGSSRSSSGGSESGSSSSASTGVPPVPPLPPSPPRQRMVVCDDSGEDPSCLLSVCHLGLCTSVADHYYYLGEMMFAGDC